MDREGFRNRLKQYKLAREENPGLKYYDFMERLAEFKAKEWNDDPDMVLQHMLNDNSYNYQQMYEDNPNFDIQEGHFVDTYKTAYHPTFSEESMYSGKKSSYNPEGIVGGSWDESTKSFYLNDPRQSKQKAQNYLNYADPGYRAIPKYDEGGGVMGPITLDEWIRQFRKKPNIVENEDDEKLIQLIRKKANNFLYLRNLTNERGLIPFIEEKAIRLSNAGKDTGVRLSTNMLDSIAKYADKADISLQDALGLVGQESTFGKGYFLDQFPITPSVLVSDWSYSDDLLAVDRTENPYVGLMRAAQQKHDSGGYDKSGRFIIYNPDYIKALRGGLPFADKEAKRLRTDIPVLEHAFKKFKSGKYNPGDPNHTQMVKDRGEALMQSPQIQKWIKENNIKYAEGGEVKLNPYTLLWN